MFLRKEALIKHMEKDAHRDFKVKAVVYQNYHVIKELKDAGATYVKIAGAISREVGWDVKPNSLRASFLSAQDHFQTSPQRDSTCQTEEPLSVSNQVENDEISPIEDCEVVTEHQDGDAAANPSDPPQNTSDSVTEPPTDKAAQPPQPDEPVKRKSAQSSRANTDTADKTNLQSVPSTQTNLKTNLETTRLKNGAGGHDSAEEDIVSMRRAFLSRVPQGETSTQDTTSSQADKSAQDQTGSANDDGSPKKIGLKLF